MKKTLILLAAVALTLSACNRGPSPALRDCRDALVQAQPFVTYSAGQLIDNHNQSSLSFVRTTIGQGAVPRGVGGGVLVIETNAPLNADEATYRAARVTNLYCT